jgi:hypothetical protein
MSLRQVLKESRNPLIRGAYRIAVRVWRFGWSQLYQHRQRKTLRLQDRDIEKAIVLAIQYIRGIGPGDIAEFGVYNGRYAKIECRELEIFGETRDVHLFDSWKGFAPLSDADAHTHLVTSGQFHPGPHRGQPAPQTLKRQLERLYHSGRIHIHQGYFSETLPGIAPGARFAMIVMDANMYAPTKEVLDYLFSHGCVCEGAMFLIPGWNLDRADPNQLARRAWREAVDTFNIKYSDEGRYYSKGAKFIVHSYDRVADRPRS